MRGNIRVLMTPRFRLKLKLRSRWLARATGLLLALQGTTASAQTAQPAAQPAEIPLEPLPELPAPKPKQKKRAAPKRKTTPAPWLSGKRKLGDAPAAEAAGAEPPPPLVVPAPPLLKLSTTIGVVVISGLDAGPAARVEAGLRAIAELAPLSTHPLLLTHPKGDCEEDACLADLGIRQQADEVLAASFTKTGLRVRAIDVSSRLRLGEQRSASVPADLLEQTALAEALACKLLVPTGCTGEASASADSAETKLELDGAALPRETRRKLPVGLHALKARLGSRVAERPLPVLHESPPGPTLTARLVGQELRLLSASELQERPVPAVALLGEPEQSPQKSRAPRIAGIVAISAGAVVGIVAALEGAHSRTQISQAEGAYHQHGGAYYQSDLAALQSGNSAARSANLLFAVSGVLVAAGLVLTLAF